MRGATDVSDARKSPSSQAIEQPYRRRRVPGRDGASRRPPARTNRRTPRSSRRRAATPAVRARSGSARPVRTARCSNVAGSQSKASSTCLPRGSGEARPSIDGRSGRRPMSPSATSTSVASRTGAQPSARSWLVPAADGHAHGARDRHDLDVTVGGLPHGVHRPAGGVGLHHHDQLGQPRDDPVAGGEPPRRRSRAERRLAQQQSLAADALPQVAVARRVHDVEARARPPRSGGLRRRGRHGGTPRRSRARGRTPPRPPPR